MPEQEFYTTEELTELFSLSRFTLWRACKAGLLKVSKKDGVRNLYSRKDVLKFIEKANKEKDN